MTWGIIGALDAEVALIRGNMKLGKTSEVYGCDYYEGTIGMEKVVVVCCSIGTINAAVCTSAMIREFGAEAVINIGIAGSTCQDLHILDVVLSEDVVFHDADLDILEKYYPFKRAFLADRRLCEEAIQAIEDLKEQGRSIRYRTGRIASGDTFVNDPAVKNRIIANFSPLCVEMEGAAVGQVAAMNNVPFLVIRTLSDNADEAADETYDNFLERAADNSANIVLRMIQNQA